MKKILLQTTALLLILVGSFSCSENDEDNFDENWCDCKEELFYYYFNERMYLDSLFLNDYLVIGFDSKIQNEDIIAYLNQTDLFNPDKYLIYPAFQDNDYTMAFVNTKQPKTCTQLKDVIRILERNSIVVFANLTFKSLLWFGGEYYDIMACSDEFIVNIKDKNDLSDLHAVVAETNTRIKEQNEFMLDVYIVSADKNSKGNAMQMAQYFHQTGKFEYAEPNFMDVKFR